MGQARNRKAEIDQLKAQGPRQKITRFLVRGVINPDGTVTFPTQDLNTAQADFTQSCQRVINTEQVPELAKTGKKATPTDSVAFVMWNGPEDFCAQLILGVKTTADEAWQEIYDHWISLTRGSNHPKLGDRFTRAQLIKMGTEQAGMAFDMLKNGGVWPWPNAGCVLEKQGDRMVVIDLL